MLSTEHHAQRNAHRAVSRDEKAPACPLDVTEAFELHGGFVFRAALHWGLCGADADDLVQEVFVVAHRRRDDFDPNGSLRAWLYGIARRIAARHHRGGRRRAALNEAIAAEPRPRVDDPAGTLELRSAAELLAEFLESLPEAQRESFVLCELEELTAREVGEVLGVSPNTVSSRVRMARGEFKRLVRRVDAQHRGVEASLRRAARGEADDARRERQWSLIVAATPGLLPAAPASVGAIGAGWWLGLKGFAITVLLGTVAVATPVLLDRASDRDPDRVATAASTPPATHSATAAARPGLPAPQRPSPHQASPDHAAGLDQPPAPAPATTSADRIRPGRAPDPASADANADPDPDALAEEVALVKAIKRASARGDHRGALELAARHAERFSGGALVEVREHARYESLCKLGRHAEAARSARDSSLPSLIAAAERGCPAA